MSCGDCSRPNPTVWTGIRRLRNVEIVSRSIPPELSAPSLSNTTAPMGRSAASPANCFRASPKALGGARRRRFQFVQLCDARQTAVHAVEANLEFFLQFVEHA